MPSEATIASLKTNLRGELIELGDAGYDTARKVTGRRFTTTPGAAPM